MASNEENGHRFGRFSRLLRRWLPGYKYLGSQRALPQPERVATPNREPEPASAAQRQIAAEETQEDSGLTLKDGEIYLNAGIAKSAFCRKLEKLLKDKPKTVNGNGNGIHQGPQKFSN